MEPLLPTTRILAISGSLRRASLNTALLRAAACLAPVGMRIELFDELGTLPLFNPDIEATDPPTVANFRARLLAADGLLIASPEYAHGITGVMKNALDWMVGCETFVNKPVALFNTSPRAVHAQASIREILTTMSARIVEAASISLPILGSWLDEAGIVSHPVMSVALSKALRTFQATISEYQTAAAGGN
ncbi:MAG: NADPH-dependent FMN reductase [Sulfuriferula sp.]